MLLIYDNDYQGLYIDDMLNDCNILGFLCYLGEYVSMKVLLRGLIIVMGAILLLLFLSRLLANLEISGMVKFACIMKRGIRRIVFILSNYY